MFKQIKHNLKNKGWSFLILLICITIPLSFRWNSYLMVISFVTGLMYHIYSKKRIEWNFFTVGCVLFFIWQGVEVFNSENAEEGIRQLERKLSFLLLPMLWQELNNTYKASLQHYIFNFYPRVIGALGVLCLVLAGINYSQTQEANVFFYHDLVYFMEANAVYFSCCLLVSLGLIFNSLNTSRIYEKGGLITLHFGYLYLLSSKMFWVLTILSLSYYILRQIKSSKRIMALSIIAVITIGLSQTGVVKNRYAEIMTDQFVINPDKITPSTTFTGLNFRIYLIQKGIEMTMDTPYDILVGNGIGDVQDQLNNAYIDDNLYLGSQKNEDYGYLNYNFHNQYIQTFAESGMVGLSLLILILGSLIGYGIRTKNESLVFLNIMFVCAFFTESYLNRAIGVFLFLAFNSIFLTINYDLKHRFKFEKRWFDAILSAIGIIFVLGWLLPILCVIIWLDMKHNPIFIQRRIGQNGQVFFCYKLRTMIKNRKANILPAQIDDVRITKIGKWLRKLGLDELPQLFNVLKGEMSLVGPRPLMVKEEQAFNKTIPGFSTRLISKPGITGLSQAFGKKGYAHTIYDIRERYRIDKLYSTKHSVWLDVKILMRTIYNMYLHKQ